jgi:hypothetical protein
MGESDEVQKLIDEINFRKTNSKNYEKMNAVEISKEFKEIMEFEQESFKKIEEFEKTQKNSDLIQYAKMICRNTTGRQISQIQEIYLKKIDKEYLNSK